MQVTTLRFGETRDQSGKMAAPTPDGATSPLVEFIDDAPLMLERFVELKGSAFPWYDIAKIEEMTGVEELRGPKHNPRILEYHATTTLHANDDETAWCSSFVNWCVKQAGLTGTNSARARSWAQWGSRLSDPREGCIVVLKRPPSPTAGHVAFYAGSHSRSRLLLLGGNQGDQVSYSSYSVDHVIGYRWP